MRCPLCGFEFDEEQSASCGGCPLRGGCSLARCPNCGYETPRKSKAAKLLERILGRAKDDGEP